MAERDEIHVAAAEGGWPHPWPNVAELAEELPAQYWTLVGGLMTQLHTIHHGLGTVRPTNDVDVILHIETTRGVPDRAAAALETLGYRLQANIDPRNDTAHRWVRDGQVVDVLAADHPAPRVVERMRGRDMVPAEGGTQALRRTVNAHLDIVDGTPSVISVPRPFGGVILKAAAYLTDSRDRDRHLYDAASLLACIEDPFVEAESLVGSDRARIRALIARLTDSHEAWARLPAQAAEEARGALRILGQA